MLFCAPNVKSITVLSITECEINYRNQVQNFARMSNLFLITPEYKYSDCDMQYVG